MEIFLKIFWIALAAVILIFIVLVARGVKEFLSRRKWKQLQKEGKISDEEYQTAIDRLDKKVER